MKFAVLYWNSAILDDSYELMVTAYHLKAAIYTECNWFWLVCSRYV